VLSRTAGRGDRRSTTLLELHCCREDM